MGSPKEIETVLLRSSELRQQIVRDIGSFTVALFALTKTEKGDHVKLAGTGTLVVHGGFHYILTAAHVWHEVLKHATRLGINLAEDIGHRFYIDVKSA